MAAQRTDPFPSDPDVMAACENTSIDTMAPSESQRGELGQKAREVKDQARQSADQVVQQAKQSAQQVKEGARELKSQVGHQAAEAARQLREKGQSLLSEQKTRAASTLEGFGKAIHDAGARLDREEDKTIASYVHGAADQVQVLASYLKDKPVENLFEDVCGMARRRPELFVGGMFVAGLLLARFAKSSHSAGQNRMYAAQDNRSDRYASDGARQDYASQEFAPPVPVSEEVAGISNNLDACAISGATADVEPVTTGQQQPRGF